MDKSDLEIYQNIVVANDNDTNEITLSSNNTTLNNYLQVCQICGVALKIDANISNMSETAYRQLSNPFFLKDDTESGLMATNVDPDMEISLSAIVSDHINNLDRSNTTNFDYEIETSSSNKRSNYEPMFRKSVAPRTFYLCPTLINIADSAHHQSSQNQDLMTGWSARINATSALFDLMSANTSIDHPLCEECADQLVNQLDMQCKIIEKEHADYTGLVGKLSQQTSNEAEIKELEAELAELELEEKKLVEQLENSEV
jgi:hypothetical protein